MTSIGNDRFDLLLPKDIVIKGCYKEIEAEIKKFFPKIGQSNTWAICEAKESENCISQYGYFDICRQIDKKMICSSCMEKREQEKVKYTGFIYLIGNIENGIYKIGISEKPRERYKAFKNKLPFEVKIIHQIPVDNMIKAEKRLHTYFSEKRTHGEWFQLDEKDLEFVLGVKEFIQDKFFTTTDKEIVI